MIRVNLLPLDYRRKKGVRPLWICGIVVIAGGLFLIGLALTLQWETAGLKEQLAAQQRTIRLLDSYRERATRLQDRLASYRSQYELLESTAGASEQGRVSDFLETVAAAAARDEGIWLTELDLASEGELFVAGAAVSHQDVGSCMDWLGQQGNYFVDIQSIERLNDAEIVQFSATVSARKGDADDS